MTPPAASSKISINSRLSSSTKILFLVSTTTTLLLLLVAINTSTSHALTTTRTLSITRTRTVTRITNRPSRCSSLQPLLLQALPSSNINSDASNSGVGSSSLSSTSSTSASTAISSLRTSSSSSSWRSLLRGFLSRRRQALHNNKDEGEDYRWTSQTLAIALPALMGLLADPVLSMVDTGFVGRIGSVMDLAALGVCTSIFHMAFTIFRASTVATTSLVASASDPAEKRHIVKISLQMAGVMGTAVLLALRLGGPALLATMGVPAGSPMYRPACDYLFARCWAAPAVVGIVVAEGAFRGNDDSKTPLIASGVAALLNLILDPLLMLYMGMGGMAGAAIATAISQVGAAGIYAWRLWRRQLLPQPTDDKAHVQAQTPKIIKSILEANLAMLAKQGSMLVFYTTATALCTRMGALHVATHQIALTLFWLVTIALDSGSISSQVLMGKNFRNSNKENNPLKAAKSLTRYMVKYSLLQGIAFSAMVGGLGSLVPGIFTQDAAVQSLLIQCLPHLALQQTLVSVTLILEGLAIGGKQFRYMAAGTALSTVAGVYQLMRATSVVGIWASAVNTFFGFRLVNAIIGVARVHWSLKKKQQQEQQEEKNNVTILL